MKKFFIIMLVLFMSVSAIIGVTSSVKHEENRKDEELIVKASYEQLILDLENDIALSLQNVAELQAEIELNGLTISNLTTSVVTYKNQVTKLENSVEKYEEDLVVKTSELEAKTGEIAELTAQLENSEEENTELLAQIEILTEEKTSLETEIAGLSAEKENLETLIDEKEAEITELSNLVSSKNAEIETLLEKRKSKGLTREEAEKLYSDSVYFATLLVECGYADGMVCGAETSTANTLRPALQIVKAKKGINLVSSCFVMYKKGLPFGTEDKVCLGDCGLNINPTSENLCDIAISTANTFNSLFGIDPKVAFLSFSSNGSGGDNEEANKVKRAVQLMKEINPPFDFDGEMQFDCAVSPKVAALKFPNSKVAGQANVFIFPDINAGNIGYKVMQYSGEMMAIGPIIQGLNKPINDVSRGATFMEIAVIAAITALQV